MKSCIPIKALEFVSKIGLECLNDLCSPVATYRLQLAEEETHYRRFLYKSESLDKIFDDDAAMLRDLRRTRYVQEYTCVAG